jgi:hypothetical protein
LGNFDEIENAGHLNVEIISDFLSTIKMEILLIDYLERGNQLMANTTQEDENSISGKMQ